MGYALKEGVVSQLRCSPRDSRYLFFCLRCLRSCILGRACTNRSKTWSSPIRLSYDIPASSLRILSPSGFILITIVRCSISPPLCTGLTWKLDWRDVPVLTALSYGASSIEADVWLSGSDLLVGLCLGLNRQPKPVFIR